MKNGYVQSVWINMTEKVFILIDKFAGKSVNYVGIHKTMHAARFHQHNRELKTKKDSTHIKVGWLTFDGNNTYEKGYQDAQDRDKFPN